MLILLFNQSNIAVVQATGGVYIAGAADVSVSYALDAVPGALYVAGTALEAVSFVEAGAGGTVIAGSALEAVAFAETAAGGLVVDGSAPVSESLVPTAGGSAVIGGAADVIFAPAGGYAEVASGGVVIGGAADVVFKRAQVGGRRFNKNVHFLPNEKAPAPQLKPPAAPRVFEYVAVAGPAIAKRGKHRAHADVAVGRVEAGDGGPVIAGEAIVSCTRAHAARGGLAVAGSAHTSKAHHCESVGGTTITGTAQVEADYWHERPFSDDEIAMLFGMAA